LKKSGRFFLLAPLAPKPQNYWN